MPSLILFSINFKKIRKYPPFGFKKNIKQITILKDKKSNFWVLEQFSENLHFYKFVGWKLRGYAFPKIS